jgi:hypothetical protein
MPHSAALLGRRAQLRIVGVGGEQRHPLVGELRLRAQRGHGGERHRQRAAEAGFGLNRALVHRGAHDVWRRLLRRPRQRVKLLAHALAHECVPRGMELHLIAPVAVPIVRVQHRRVLVGEDAPGHRLAAPECADRAQPDAGVGAALSFERLDERQVVLEEVPALEPRRLVEDLVGGGGAASRGHGRPPGR